MLITGVIHGGTLSMTRLFGKPEFYRWRNIDEEEWNPNGDVFSSAIGHAAHGLGHQCVAGSSYQYSCAVAARRLDE